MSQVSPPEVESSRPDAGLSPRATLAAGAQVSFRPFRPSDRAPVIRLLSILPRLYPGGRAWLERRLDDVLAGRARCTVALGPWGVVGTTIETPKGARRLKLSTIYVHPRFRGLSVGTGLLERCRADWLREGRSVVHVTADARRAPLLLPLFTQFDFKAEALEAARYGPGRDETVFSWEPHG